MTKIIVVSILIVLLLVGAYFGLPVALNYMLTGKAKIPGVSDYVAMAKPWNATVQAIYDYKADHGSMPKTLSDLVPGYIAVIPTPTQGTAVELTDDSLLIMPGLPHTGMYYSFQQGHEGWEVGGDFGVGPLPLPKLASTHPSVRRRHRATSRSATKPAGVH